MLLTILGWFMTGICVATFVILWFHTSFRKLSAKSKSLEAISEQVQFQRRLYMQERGGCNDAAAQYILENKLIVYREVEKDYKALLKKPVHRIPGYIMGFRLPEGK